MSKTLHYCKCCDRWFDSPSICIIHGTETEPVVFGGK